MPSGHSAKVLPFPSLIEKGFLNELPYTIAVADWSEPEVAEISSVGRVETSVVTLQDESVYVFRKTIPTHMEWGTSVDFTAPLATRVKGYNSYLARKLAQANMHSRIVGTNQSRGFSLLHDAQATLHLLNLDDEAGSCTPGESISIGYSMGTMKKLAEVGLADSMGRRDPFTLGLDPCLAEKVDYAREYDDLAEVCRYLGREALEIPLIFAKSLLRESPIHATKRMLHLVGTVGITPTYYKGVREKWHVLASGETGSFPAAVPPDAAMVLHFFGKCRYNNFPAYQELFKNHANVRLVLEDGFHLSGSDPRVVSRVVEKAALAQDLLEQDLALKDIVDLLSRPILAA